MAPVAHLQEIAVDRFDAPQGYTPAEERRMNRRVRELMDDPDMDAICKLMGAGGCSHLAALLWDGKRDQAAHYLHNWGRLWAEHEAEKEMR